MLVDQADTPLFLGAIHRILLGTTLDDLAPRLPDPSPRSRRVAAADGVRRTVARTPWSPPTARAGPPSSWPCRADRAAVEVLHDELLPGARRHRPAASGYHHTVDEALGRLRPAPGVAVLMPAPDFDLVVRVAQAGRLLPEKATSFQPKPSIGVLIRSLRDE